MTASGRHLQRLAGAEWLRRPATVAVLQALLRHGHEARIVGGTVRDALLGRPIGDIDIATTAVPDETIAAAQAAGLQVAETGREHGTITVIADRVGYEVTTLRRDVSTDGRRAVVAFTHDWREDAIRRDFTINALSCDRDGTVYDYTGGIRDLSAHRVCFIGDPRARIREDYLRILRFYRFSAELTDNALDNSGRDACRAEASGLARISAERIRNELLKLLVAPRAVTILTAMHDDGLLTRCLGAPADLALLNAVAEREAAIRLKPDALRRLASLIRALPPHAVATRLRLSTAESRFIAATGAAIGTTEVQSDHDARTLLYRLGTDVFRAAILMRWSQSGLPSSEPAWQAYATLPDRWTPPQFPISGGDLLDIGMSAGPAVGRLLADLEAWWIARDFAPAKADVIAQAQRRLRDI